MTARPDSPLDLQLIFNAAPGLFLVLAADSPRFTIVAASDAYLHASRKQRSELIGRGLFEVFPDHGDHADHADHADRPEAAGAPATPGTRASLARVMAARAPDTLALQRCDSTRPQAPRGAGQERQWRAVNSPVFDASGALAYLIHSIEDVTDPVRASQQAEAAQARLAMIVASSDDAIISKSLDGVVQTWNAAAERIFGYAAEEIVGMPATLLIPPERWADEVQILQRLQRGEAIGHYECVRLTKDGRRIDVSLTTSALKDALGQVVGASKIIRDITERKQAEQALRESEQRLRALVMASSDLMCRMSPDWSQMNQIYDKNLVVATTVSNANWLESYVYRDDQPRLMALVNEAIQTKSLFEMEHRVRRADGSWGWMLSRAVPVLDPGGEIVEWFGTGSDVTEQKRAEQALRDSEQRYRGLFNSIDEGFCVIELLFDEHNKPLDFRFVEVNPAFESKTGLHAAAGKRVRELLPDLEASWFEHFGQVALTGEPERFAGEVKALGQSWFDVYAFRLGGPEISRVAVIFSAITERIRRERSLAFLVELQQTLVGIDSSAELLRVASERIAGYLQLRHCVLSEIDQAAGQATVLHEHLASGAPALQRIRPLTELRTEAQRQALAAGQTLVSADVLLEGRGAVELQRLAARGVRSQVSAPYVVDGHWQFLLTAIRGQPGDWKPEDVELVTELATRVYVQLQRTRVQERLVESEQRLRLAAEAAHFGMYDRELPGGQFHVSAQLKQMLGYDSDAPLGHTQIASHYHPDDRAAGLAAYQRACDPAGDGQISVEQRIVRRDGSQRWIASVGRVLFERGVPVRSIGFWVDITARKQLEQESLEQARELADLDRRKDEFLAMLGHELRNPLAAMANAVQLLRVQKNAGEAQRQAGTIIERQVGQLKHLVDDLLEVSRIVSGRIQLRPDWLDLRGVVARAVEATGSLVTQHHHELTLALPPEPVWLYADGARLEQVLVNLLNNAAKYTEDRGRISVAVDQQADTLVPMALISVHDNGIGIAPELLPRVFDLFTQADQTLHRSQGGLGIGLSLVRRLVELHGGTVTASSVPGQGSEFVVRLPLRPLADGRIEAGTALSASSSSSASPTSSAASAASAGGGSRVLLVDDNVDAVQSLAVLLEMSGHEIRIAYDGLSAIEAAIDFRPEVVFLDIGLPGLDGYQTAQRIRQQAGLAGIVLIALTGYGLESDRQRSQQAGFDHHLVKPASLDEIEALLRSVAENKLAS